MILFVLGVVVASFGAGIGAYRCVLEMANLDTVPEGSYVLKEAGESLRYHYALTGPNLATLGYGYGVSL